VVVLIICGNFDAAASIRLDYSPLSEVDGTNHDGDQPKPVRKYVYLPPRSLLILTGESRYNWSHGISPRKFDKLNGDLVPRGRRVSFTFRHVVKPGPIPSSQLVGGSIEQEHVVKVYDAIALHWNHTRGKRKVHWHRVKDFLDMLPPGTLLADVGSGDGKYFGVNPNVTTIGCDRSWNLLQVSREPGHETFCCDAVKLPFVSGMFDAVVCIAVLHHMASVDRRFAVIRELVRIARVGGEILIQAWALEQGDDSKHVFATQDTMVPWKLNMRFALPSGQGTTRAMIEETRAEAISKSKVKGKVTSVATSSNQDEIVVYDRYCHVYKEGELEDLCSRVPGCRVVESGWDKGNWFVRIVKVNDERLQGAAAICGPEAKLPAMVPRLKAEN
jgi:alkylated DNA repair protein alkB homolog 8